MTVVDNGWDSRAWLDGEWLHREPRRPEIRPRLLAETRLLPWLAPQLPLPVPLPEPTEHGVRHRLLAGEPLQDDSRALGHQLGQFLKALHAVDPAEAVKLGAVDAERADADKQRFLAECLNHVVPLLPDDRREDAAALLRRVGGPRTALVHSDVGPDHVRVTDGRITGIIDWTDAEIGDPAVDLSWPLFGSGPQFAGGVAAAYGVDDEVRARAHDWHRLGPWYEVHRGVVLGLPADVPGATAAILRRL